MNSHFDLIGGFVVRLVAIDLLEKVRATLADMSFSVANVDGKLITNKPTLLKAFHDSLGLSDYSPQASLGWDSFSDFLWQKFMDRKITKQALILDKSLSLQSNNAELLFQLAETLFHVQNGVSDVRIREDEPPLMIRLFLIQN